MSDVVRSLRELRQAIENPGRTARTNPLIAWDNAYTRRSMRARVPRVTGGSFRGNKWDPIGPQYYRGAQNVSLRTRGTLTPSQLRAQGKILAGVGGTLTPSQARRVGRRRRRVSGGTPVPGWGGVPKIRGKGRVKGAKRASGARYTRGSGLLRDTDRMFRDAFGSDPVLSRGNKRLRRAVSTEYAAKQHERRPFMHGPQILRDERASLIAEHNAWLKRLLARFSR